MNCVSSQRAIAAMMLPMPTKINLLDRGRRTLVLALTGR
ncbi:hypothetical protein I553_8534 [Mycobacterium xenopi 4042]|uniref:Uncharacterized protein n=1 Tax=Mycobacterium xenopi 4042 TaxID=1299334 RepID=X8CKX0_MYCXE|nr:hypothetical protein I553_8534 [Mycobacterium xenopi 4042]